MDPSFTEFFDTDILTTDILTIELQIDGDLTKASLLEYNNLETLTELRIDGNLTKPSLLEYNKLGTLFQRFLETHDLQSLQRMLSDTGLYVEIPEIPAYSDCQIQIRYPDFVELIDESVLYMAPLKINQPVGGFVIEMEIEDEGKIGEVQSNFAEEDIHRESDTRVKMIKQDTNIISLDSRIESCYILVDVEFLDETDILF